MRMEIENDKLVACLSGRIDSTNAIDIQRALEKYRDENPSRELEIDAGGLAYISSAGHRQQRIPVT